LLEQLRKQAEAVDADVQVPGMLQGTPAGAAFAKRHGHMQAAQRELRESITLWAGVRRDRAMQDSEIYRRFYHTFGVDIASAQSLGTKEAEALTGKIQEKYWNA